MVQVMLDIGAGNKFFAKRFRRRNKKEKWLIFCGEPDWSDWCNGEKLITSGKAGIYKVCGKHSDFHLPDQCLDIVTLNAYNVVVPPDGIVEELIRCLKPSGFFFSAHPVGYHPSLPQEYFEPFPSKVSNERERMIVFPDTRPLTSMIHLEMTGINWERTIKYPASIVIQNRLSLVGIEDPEYLYSGNSSSPTLRVWQRVIGPNDEVQFGAPKENRAV